MNKSIIAIVIIAAIVLGGYFLFRGASQSTTLVTRPSSEQTTSQSPVSGQPSNEPNSLPSTGQPPAIEEKVVTYTDSGYSSSIIMVKKGETVIFKNQGSKSMWTASAVHPTHRVYPTTGGCLGSTFDACKGVQSGDSWSFKFDIAGTWKYHNHLSPSDIGTVVVE